MKILIAEDDMISRKVLNKFLSQYGECDLVIDGMEAIEAYMLSIKDKSYYDLICLDIMMPKFDGLQVLKTIRKIEQQNHVKSEEQVKIIMTTALSDTEYVQEAFEYGCEAYASKPIDMNKLVEVMKKIGFKI
ncbi:response regulator [Anaerophilus nitritogenes]|uniref:response regulator n=1 Tax=Anaerophilus nitritogenes TaxID=2498136 RepID=UPI00101C5324|nr:response regulator [Anaerophilus nitritogenes]